MLFNDIVLLWTNLQVVLLMAVILIRTKQFGVNNNITLIISNLLFLIRKTGIFGNIFNIFFLKPAFINAQNIGMYFLLIGNIVNLYPLSGLVNTAFRTQVNLLILFGKQVVFALLLSVVDADVLYFLRILALHIFHPIGLNRVEFDVIQHNLRCTTVLYHQILVNWHLNLR